MAVYVIDTHALIWYLIGSTRISLAARTALDDVVAGGSERHVPAIVPAELVMLAEKRRLIFDFKRMVETLRSLAGFQFTSLQPDTVLRAQALVALTDIHDRLIVAESLESNATLITRDQAIAASGLASALW
ncbi:MAG: PIN domain-containing protein [Anaerolineales bacterium]|nr:PIN domain-containing protein [Anaerolineales bacterium]